MKIDYDALDRACEVIRSAGIAIPVSDDDYFELARYARSVGLLSAEQEEAHNSAYANAVRKCAELLENPDRLLSEDRFTDVLLGEGYRAPEQPLDAIRYKHEFLLGQWLNRKEDERTAIENALCMLDGMAERYHHMEHSGVTLYGVKIRDTTDLKILCDLR